MSERPMTVTAMARIGGVARAKAHSMAELREWGKRGGRPGKLDRKGLAALKRPLATGTTQAECAAILGVSVRTIGSNEASRPTALRKLQPNKFSWPRTGGATDSKPLHSVPR